MGFVVRVRYADGSEKNTDYPDSFARAGMKMHERYAESAVVYAEVRNTENGSVENSIGRKG